MSGGVKTDNKSLALKVALRLEVLRRAALPELRVLDLCAGAGHVWTAMQQQVELAAYTPVDLEPRLPGTLRGDVMEDRFITALQPERYNVLDVDTYGEPWRPWAACAARVGARTAVFLTCGLRSSQSGARVSAYAREAMGIPVAWEYPSKSALALFAQDYALAATCARLRVRKALRARPDATTTYWGLIVEPAA